VTCKHLQKRMLQGYLDVLKKNVKPIKLQVGNETAKQTVQNAVNELFGEGATFDQIFEVK